MPAIEPHVLTCLNCQLCYGAVALVLAGIWFKARWLAMAATVAACGLLLMFFWLRFGGAP